MSKIRLTTVLVVSVLLSLTAVAVAATINGTNGDDFLVGTPRNDDINARGGDDTVFGLRGNDEIEGGRGDDRLFGDGDCPPGVTDPDYCDEEGPENGDDKGRDDNGRDDDDDDERRRRRARFNDDIDGGRGNDYISGGPGSDEIDAEDNQRDTIRCGPGRDRVEADDEDIVNRDCERVRRD